MTEESYSKKALIKALADGHAYDYVAAFYWQMPKEDLKQVILELIYALDGLPFKKDRDEVLQAASAELESQWADEEEEGE